MADKIELGDQVKCTITGFKGIAIGHTKWIHGCDRIVVQPKIGKDGKLGENASFDEPQLVIVKKKAVKKVKSKTGGPRMTPQKRSMPSRF